VKVSNVMGLYSGGLIFGGGGGAYIRWGVRGTYNRRFTVFKLPAI
jgi:hypothetical protein